MIETVTLSALTAFLTAVGNGAGGEIGKNIRLSTGAQVRRTLRREVPLPTSPEGCDLLARQVHPRMDQDLRLGAEWAQLVRDRADDAVPALRRGPGLPPPTRHFTDREGVLRRLKRELTRAAAGRPRAVLLYGAPGVGTSAVALYWGADSVHRFPDGQFYVDLRDAGGDHGPAPAAVLLLLLRRMGVDPERMPSTEAGREDLYRTLTAGRRILVVVDHASAAAQVRAVIPSTPDVFLLVVSSGPCFDFEAELVEVPGLADRDAKQLLKRVAGKEALARRADDVSDAVARCGGNALALRAAAVRLLAGEQLSPGVRGTAATGDPVRDTVRTVCLRLGPEAARLCRLTALGGWPAFDAALAGRAAGVATPEAAGLLERAAEARLVERLPDARYRFRPEVRRCLEDAAGPEHGIAECSAAVSRSLDDLVQRALRAAHAALPESWRVEHPPAFEEAPHAEGGPPDEDTGLKVLRAEAGNLVRAVSVAEEYQQYDTVLRLGRSLWPLQLKSGHLDEVLPALRTAARRADDRQPDSRTAAALHFQLAHCLGELRHPEEAAREGHAAVACERVAGHLLGEASALEMLGLIDLNQWLYEAAYERFLEAEQVYRRIAPGGDGTADLPRALNLVKRHQGRALRGLGRLEESRALLEPVAAFFADRGETYNQARALTDLAETLHAADDDSAASARIAEAERLLPVNAATHLAYLARLRERCQTRRQP
ncbi:ATP-binding protein [Streptomyces sp. NPDC059398]|uniref:ATP-binding protein n=1 Tax=Streptomyces sp. NPDC059398 TaxID=3346820 RepID=UPI00368C9388